MKEYRTETPGMAKTAKEEAADKVFQDFNIEEIISAMFELGALVECGGGLISQKTKNLFFRLVKAADEGDE